MVQKHGFLADISFEQRIAQLCDSLEKGGKKQPDHETAFGKQSLTF